MAARAPLIELFASVQGEGRFLGVPMTFLRVATCPLRCLYCDTPHSYSAPPALPVRVGPAARNEPNPVAAERAAELVQRVAMAAAIPGAPARLSITGGEPLVFPAFVRELGARVRQQGFRVHLETAALDADALQQCVAEIDHLSADYKLPETLPDGARHGAQHVRCIERALARGATVDVKVVLTPAVRDDSLEQAFADLAPHRRRIVLVLQPVTPFGAVRQAVAAADLERWAGAAARAGFDLRVLPQTHKVLQLP